MNRIGDYIRDNRDGKSFDFIADTNLGLSGKLCIDGKVHNGLRVFLHPSKKDRVPGGVLEAFQRYSYNWKSGHFHSQKALAV